MLYLPCPFYSEWHHEDAYSAETYRECGQVSLSTLWYCHRSQKWPWWVASCPYFMGKISRIQLLDWSLNPYCQQKMRSFSCLFVFYCLLQVFTCESNIHLSRWERNAATVMPSFMSAMLSFSTRRPTKMRSVSSVTSATIAADRCVKCGT